jgi:hypothetical protein
MGLRSNKWLPLSVARAFMWRWLALREAKYLRDNFGAAADNRFGSEGVSDAVKADQRDVFFVLANGDSVNELRETQFRVIEKHFSVGLNAWPLHPFVPNAYGFELWEGLDRNPREFDFLVDSACKKSNVRGSSLWLLRPRQSEFGRLEKLRSDIPALRFRVYGRANVPTRSLGALDAELTRSFAFLARNRRLREVLIDNGSSVVRMISLGLVLGFKKIVLVGVDLNDSPYFWYDTQFIRRHGDFTDLCQREPGEGRDTLSTDTRPFSALDFIFALNRVAAARFGAEIFVSSSSSALAAGLEVFGFPRAG